MKMNILKASFHFNIDAIAPVKIPAYWLINVTYWLRKYKPSIYSKTGLLAIKNKINLINNLRMIF